MNTASAPAALAAPELAPQTSAPFPASSAPSSGIAEAVPLTEGALAKVPGAAPAGMPDVETLRTAIGSALAEGGHASAAELLSGAAWTMEGASIRIEVPGMGKKMLALTVNSAAEKIMRQELQRLNAPTRFMVVPGAGSAPAVTGAAAPLAGSIQESALAHPLVGRAREIFNAEVRSVVDLRQK